MGLQLRDALQCLCVEIGWTYAVFWRAVESGNPTHFVWEDGHWVQDSLSNYSAEFQCQAEDRVKLLVNKLMVPQVHVIGDGVVGQAAFSGSHQWIVRDAHNDYGSVYKDLAELNHQFMAGIQTIAVIPVLPHGVLQLGSTQMVMENIGFVNHVRNLFAQLKCVTGALLPFVTKKALTQNSQLYDEIPPIASKVMRNKLTITTTKVPVNEPFLPMIHPVDARLIQLPLSHDSTSKYEDQPSVLTSGLSSSSLPFLEQLLAMSSISSWESANITEPASIDNKALHLRSHRCMLPNSLKDSNIISLFGRSETSENANGLGRFRSLPGDSRESIGIPYATSSSTEAAQMLNQRNHSKSSQGISVDPCPSDLSINNSQSVLTVGKRKQENDLFHTCDVPFTEFDVNGPCYWALFSTLQECRLSSSNTVQENHNAIWDANDTNTTKNKQNMKDNDESKLPRIFPKQTTSGNDLYDVLGPDYKIDNFGGSLDDVFVHKGDASIHELATDISTCTTQLDVCPISHSMNNGISGAGMFSIADADQLLDAVVSKINSGAKQNSDDNASCKTSVTKISSSSLPVVSLNYDLVASSEQNQGESFGLSPMLGKPEVAGSSSVKSACSLGNVTEECSQSAGVHKSQISLWVESGQSMKCDDNLSGAHCKRVDETGKVNQKRARPGKNPRPRPKDRQMIMDRVKELREIVPNGAKCSIDALLEKTIKHMLFLQSVTKHADKLKDIGEPKFINKEGGLLLKENFEGGATWAFEIGTQSMTCPIIVEDLNPPRQMLVEMLWEQRGFFLEIADLIRGLGLTILKGWMEARKDKIWARFAIEANRDVTRMEIFLLLVRLLEPTVGSQTTPQGVDNINMPHNMYHRSCIPATGTSDRLRGCRHHLRSCLGPSYEEIYSLGRS